MDFESEKLIQNMLAQDAAEQVLFNPLLTPSVTPSKRWSKEEIDCLKSALKIYGNQYSKISSIVFQGSRTSLQVKNRVQHMSYYGQLDDDQKTIVKQVKPVLKPVVKTKFKTPISTNADTISAVIPPVIISDDDVDIDEPIIKETSASIPITYNNLESDSDSSSEPESKNTIESFDLNNNIQINRDSIQQFEMSGNPEFFNPKGRVNKSADRYKLIRNHILDLWEIHRPKFVNKTLSRKGLIGHGDVNSISNIWNFLNNVGAINIGVVKKVKQVKVKRERKEKLDELDLGISVLPHKMLHIPFSKRVRKVKGDDGEWINETDYNGRVIDHELLESKTLQERLGFEKMLSKKKKRVHNHSWESDPFRLVEPSKSTPPFKVCISQKAMITIDFHSHLAHTEVIGLFGGSFDLTNKTLSIEIAYPCNSVSTSIQCEMDPISEMKAREYFIELGIRVVGWYHSHPTFVPDPSIRDIENQAAYQCLFRREDGIEPFIGAIVNPYHENQISRISFVGISDIWSCDGFRVPYSYDVGLIEFCDIDVLIGELESLLERYNDYEHKIDMSETFLQVGETQISRLDKMVASLDSHLGEMEMEKRFGFLNQIRELFQS